MPTRPPTFRPFGTPTRRERERAYDRRRGTAHQRGYTHALRRSMEDWKRGHPLCLGCEAVGRVTATEVTDHIVPHKGDAALLVDPANWQPACRPHHDIVKRRLEEMFARGSITADALRLDSATAVRLTLDFLA